MTWTHIHVPPPGDVYDAVSSVTTRGAVAYRRSVDFTSLIRMLPRRRALFSPATAPFSFRMRSTFYTPLQVSPTPRTFTADLFRLSPYRHILAVCVKLLWRVGLALAMACGVSNGFQPVSPFATRCDSTYFFNFKDGSSLAANKLTIENKLSSKCALAQAVTRYSGTLPQLLARAKRVRRSMSERPALRRAQSRTHVQSKRE